MVNALLEAQQLRLDCVQVFTKNQRQWAVRAMPAEEEQAWLAQLASMGWDDPRDGRVVSHNSYLINMASPDRDLWERSVRLQRVELERCERLRIPFCVAHPGAHMGASRPPRSPNPLREPPSRDELAGLHRIVKALDRLHRELAGYRTLTLLETTTGAGTALGYDFAHLAFIRAHVREPERVGFCFDTCHVTAAGYDMHTDRAAAAVLDEWHKICHNKHLHAFHLNDSVGALGSRRDRHAHIGHGSCGMACFRAVMNHPGFASVPKILETPKETDEKGVPWDLRNIRRLRRLIRRPHPSR
ncbi:MAG: deoxyribonuclease IV [Phycisphaerales bacterium]|nr:deoxyribonuclease IV [Phycisphaerales bacterium]